MNLKDDEDDENNLSWLPCDTRFEGDKMYCGCIIDKNDEEISHG